MYLRAETPMKFYQSRKKPAMSMLRAETPRLYEKNKENQSEYRADISHHHGPDELRAGLFFGDVQPLCVHRSDDRHGQAHQKTDAADKVEQKSHERQRKKYLPALRKALFFRRLDLFSAAGFIIFRRIICRIWNWRERWYQNEDMKKWNFFMKALQMYCRN